MPKTQCEGCRRLQRRVAELEATVRELRDLVRDLQAQLAQNSSNSSLPPSANPPAAPPPVVKEPTGRKPGGQPGHPPHLRQRLPAERLTRVVRYVPRHCQQCQALLPAQAGPKDPEPTWHQVAELPALAAQVTEYQGHSRTCPDCGAVNHAPIPAAIKAHSLGPRLAATLAYLAGCHHVSKRGLEEVVETVFEVPVALGTVSHLEQQMSDALGPAHAEAVAAVRAAPVKHVDETGWKQAGKLCWLWVAATATVAAFLIHARRNLTALRALVGEGLYGILCSDRWSAYNAWPVLRRQVCWAHLKRDFRKCLERGGDGERIGKAGLKAVRRVFEEWYLFRGGGIKRATLIARLDPVAARLHRVLEGGCACADPKVATFCTNVLAIIPAVWRFVVTEGIEPTNNQAERVLRRGVLWRKNAFGCHSVEGCRFVERVLTVVQTLRLQKRSVLSYLVEAVVAHRSGLPAPKLLPTG